MDAAPRPRDVRLADTRHRLENDVDLWARWEAYAARTGWDPREAGPGYAAYVVTPVTIQAWREYPELADRTLMRAGRLLP